MIHLLDGFLVLPWVILWIYFAVAFFRRAWDFQVAVFRYSSMLNMRSSLLA